MSNEPAVDQGGDELKFQCPACRAKQSLRDTCRRCGADLWLLARAKLRVAWLIQERRSALASGDRQQAMQHSRELRWLQPGWCNCESRK